MKNETRQKFLHSTLRVYKTGNTKIKNRTHVADIERFSTIPSDKILATFRRTANEISPVVLINERMRTSPV